MSIQGNTKISKLNIKGLATSIAWFALAIQQAFSGYVLLTNFDNYLVLGAAGVSLLLATTVVAVHFFKAHE